MSDEITVEQATFTPKSGPAAAGGAAQPIPVHFNPVSLQLQLSNTLEEKGSGDDKKQYVTKSSAKLTLDLIFDTTDDGSDVRVHTEKIAAFMVPDEQKVPAIVLFEWGTFTFQGMVESYKETIDFFAPAGVPLRATVNLTLARQEKVFTPDERRDAPPPEPVIAPVPAGDGISQVSARAGAPGAARALGAANGLATLRFSAGPVALDASVKLAGPAAFASGGAGLSLGAGIGIGGGLGVSAGAGIGIGGSAGAGLSVGSNGAGISARGAFGAGASAGVSASGGAFAGLRASTSVRPPSFKLDTNRLTPPRIAASLPTDRGASFAVGGQASLRGAAGLSADVGATANLRGRITFEGV